MSRDTSTSPPQAPREVVVFINRGAAILWLCVAGFGLALFFSSGGGMRGIAFGLVALFGLQATISFALGVRLAKGRVALPRAPWTGQPLLIVGRTSFPLALLRDIDYVGRVHTFEFIRLSADNGKYAALFESRNRRLSFFDEVRRRTPSLKIYRS